MHSFCTLLPVNLLLISKRKIMADNNRNQQKPTERNQQQTEQERTRSGQNQNISGQNIEDNPQRGSEWSNYQTRELSSKEAGLSRSDLDEE